MKWLGGCSCNFFATTLLMHALEAAWSDYGTRLLIVVICGTLYSIGGGFLWAAAK